MPTDLRSEKERLKARLAEIEKAEREEAERRFVIAGRVALSAMEVDPVFAESFRRLLDDGVIKKRERQIMNLSDKSKPHNSGSDTV